MILITVLCRFSLLIVKYFLKHLKKRHSPGLDEAWLLSPKNRAVALSAKGTNDFWTKMDSPVLRLSVGGERFGNRSGCPSLSKRSLPGGVADWMAQEY